MNLFSKTVDFISSVDLMIAATLLIGFIVVYPAVSGLVIVVLNKLRVSWINDDKRSAAATWPVSVPIIITVYCIKYFFLFIGKVMIGIMDKVSQHGKVDCKNCNKMFYPKERFSRDEYGDLIKKVYIVTCSDDCHKSYSNKVSKLPTASARKG